MIKSIMHNDFADWQVRDLDTGEILRGVQYADDSIGLVVIREKAERGSLQRVRWMNIRLESKRPKEEPNPYDPDPLMDALISAKGLVEALEVMVRERRHWGEMINEKIAQSVRENLFK